MSKDIFIGILTEGPTDNRFLLPVVQRTFEHIAFECPGEVDVYPPTILDIPKARFVEMALHAAQQAEKQGCMILCIHTDADEASDERAFFSKIQPAFTAIAQTPNPICKNLVAIVPVQMTEAWLMADKHLLKKAFAQLISTNPIFSDFELGIDKHPESYPDPKETILAAIRRTMSTFPKKQRDGIQLSELYQFIGEEATIEKLAQLPSFQKFMIAVRTALHKLGYLPII